MGLLQIQDVFEPYYAGKEAARSGPAGLDSATATDESRPASQTALSHKERLDRVEKRFASALGRIRKPDR